MIIIVIIFYAFALGVVQMAQKNWLEIEINNKNHKKEKNTKKYKKVLAIWTLIGYTKRAVA